MIHKNVKHDHVVDIPLPWITYPELNSCSQYGHLHCQSEHCFCSFWNHFEIIQLQSSTLLHPQQTHLYREFHTIQLKEEIAKTPIVKVRSPYNNVKIAINQYTISIGTNSLKSAVYGGSLNSKMGKKNHLKYKYKAFTYPDKQLHLTEIVLSILNHNGHYLNSRVESEEKKNTQNN